MERKNEIFLDILKFALLGEDYIPKEETGPEDWAGIFSLAQQHNLFPMIYEASFKNAEINGREAYGNMARRLLAFQALRTEEFGRLYKSLGERGLFPVVVKGAVCRSIYPKPDSRFSADEDLFVEEELFSEYRKVLKEFGMESEASEEEAENSFEIPFKSRDGLLYIELHKKLFSPESRTFGSWNGFFEDTFGRTVSVGEFRTLSHTDHIFYLICHALKHFLHSGVGIRQVCDIIMYANAFGTEIDWEQLFKNCKAIKAEIFAGAIFRIGEKYLCFEPEKAGYPKFWNEIKIDETGLLEDMLSAGIYGGATMSRRHSGRITLDAAEEKKNSLIGSVFPSAKELSGRYPYLRKQPYLLPAAWISRIFGYIAEKKNRKDDSAAEAIKIGRRRTELLKEYKVIE